MLPYVAETLQELLYSHLSKLWGTKEESYGTYHASLGGLAQESSKGDDGGHAGAVKEEEGGQTLQTNGICVVGKIVRSLSLDVQD